VEAEMGAKVEAMGVVDQVLRMLGLADPPQPGTPSAGRLCVAENQELAERLRRLPGRFSDRLPASVLRRITGSAACGRWEKAIDQLVMALYVRDAPVTATERQELRTVLRALDLPAHRLDRLPGTDD
jgi:hypothetical protein